MLTIYNIPVSIYTAKLRVVLRRKGLEWEELPPPGGYRSEAYRKIVPSGNIPTLIDGNVMLSDSEAIAEYLEEKHPEPSMMPVGLVPRAKARERGRFHDTRLEPALRAMYPLLKERAPDALEAGFKEIDRHLAALELLLTTDGLPTRALLLCDAGFAVTFEWLASLERALGLELTWPSSVVAYRKRLSSYPSVADELEHYRSAIRAYLHPQE
ncbi:MAG: glutathione S-transferase N-terminal domain-containing protein [Planktotalea sp.]|uniref:glutathione S-transferase family protein n=1 Tax=Planktotalea sp. TaxID=2029877 RepID=UPI003C7463C8